MCCLSTFSNLFSSEATGWIEAKFHTEPQWEGGTEVCFQGLGHMTKVAATPICGKNPPKNLLLQNEKAYDLATWNVASVTQAHHSLYKS